MADRLKNSGFHPIDECPPGPHGRCVLRFGPKDYALAYRKEDGIWLEQQTYTPLGEPTHFMDLPD